MGGPSCRLCGSPDTGFYCEKRGYKVFTCRSCGNGFLDPDAKLDPAEFYGSDYHEKKNAGDPDKGYDDYYALAPALRRTFQQRLDALLTLQGPAAGPRRLLEIGCGPGYFLELAAARYAVCGVELGRDAAARARKIPGAEILEGEFSASLFPPSRFDAVVLFDTLEHVTQPRQLVEDVYAALKPGGLLMLSTGDFSSAPARLCGSRWHLITPPEHLFYFTRGGLERLLGDAGFELLCVSHPGGHYTLDYLLERVVKSLGVGEAYRRRPGLRALLKKAVLPVNLWDIMLVAARKPAGR